MFSLVEPQYIVDPAPFVQALFMPPTLLLGSQGLVLEPIKSVRFIAEPGNLPKPARALSAEDNFLSVDVQAVHHPQCINQTSLLWIDG